MGIDARILIRYKGEKPTEKQLAVWSFDICDRLGADKFFTVDGLPPSDYPAAHNAWYAAFKAHPAYAFFESTDDWKKKQEHRAKIIADTGEAPKELRRAVSLCDPYDSGAEAGKLYSQDGPDIVAEDGEWLLDVSVWSRYYGEGYERGDLMFICNVAEWIEANIPTAAVWYGGDSSGVLAEPFGVAEREAMRKHFFGKHGNDYRGGWSAHFGRDSTTRTRPAPCGLCVPGEPRFRQYGTGKDYCAVSCGGCGKDFETRDNGKTWAIVEEK